ncbi:glycoside hydrolase family 88 protein [candidate division KSB1 bacterium]|nr:glycoside hydrolase family 88 protein [candidate division KSB1 bacterium]
MRSRVKIATTLICIAWTYVAVPQELDSLIEASLPFVFDQLEQSTQEIANVSRHPEKTEPNGRWLLHNRDNWTSGFFSGALWYAYALTEEPHWRDYAIAWSSDLESRKNSTGTHDVGFQMMSSWGNWFKLTGREQNVEVLLQTARSLAKRYNETIGCIRSWGGVNDTQNFLVIVDNMMNLELLFWAAAHGGEQRFYDIAVRHAEKTMQQHVRDDGSTFHVIDYNFDGTVKRKYTHQGYADWSTWSRGQAWGIYGFSMTYRETKNPQFLQTAIKMADYFLANLPDDFVPYSDFNSPNIPNESKDASAASITCSALFELDTFVEGDKYKKAAENILIALLSNYLAAGTPLSSILQKGCVRYGSHEQGLIYADYYVLEAIIRYLGIELKPIDPQEPEERLFSDIPFFGDANNYQPYTSSRWSVGPDQGDQRYYINTSDYTNQDGERVGEYSLLKDSVYTDFTLTFKAKSPENLSGNDWVDFTVIFGFLNNDNYNYAMLNSNPAENGNAVFAVRNGIRQRIDFVSQAGIVDNNYHAFQFIKQGNTIHVAIDGTLFYRFASADLAQTGAVGVGSYNDAVYFDDILMTRTGDTRSTNMPAQPVSFALFPNHPNPFNNNTTIQFVIEKPQYIELMVHDATGRLVATLFRGSHAAGRGQLVWDGRNDAGGNVSSGVYLLSLTGSENKVIRKILLIK